MLWLRRYGLTLLGLLITAYSVLLLADTVPGYLGKHDRILELQRETAGLRNQQALQVRYLNDLTGNRAVIEDEVRRELKLNKPGETTYIYQDQRKPLR